MTVRAPAERRFRRAQVKPVRRRRARSWVTWRAVRIAAVLVLVAYAAYRGVALAVAAPMLQVSHVVVHGNVRLSSGEVEAIVGGLQGSSIITADLDGYRRKLKASPWVADVALRRVLPSTIEVYVSERRPVGLCRLGGELYLIDRNAVVIDQFGPQYSEFDLPIIDGLVRAPGEGPSAIDEGRVDLAARVIDAVSASGEVARRVSQIDVSDAHDAVVLLDSDQASLHLGEEHFLERLQSYIDLAPALRDQVGEIDYVDLRFHERVYVRPGSKRNAAHDRSAATRLH
jgi:cell division protein FtsQ